MSGRVWPCARHEIEYGRPQPDCEDCKQLQEQDNDE